MTIDPTTSVVDLVHTIPVTAVRVTMTIDASTATKTKNRNGLVVDQHPSMIPLNCTDSTDLRRVVRKSHETQSRINVVDVITDMTIAVEHGNKDQENNRRDNVGGGTITMGNILDTKLDDGGFNWEEFFNID